MASKTISKTVTNSKLYITGRGYVDTLEHRFLRLEQFTWKWNYNTFNSNADFPYSSSFTLGYEDYATKELLDSYRFKIVRTITNEDYTSFEDLTSYRTFDINSLNSFPNNIAYRSFTFNYSSQDPIFKFKINIYRYYEKTGSRNPQSVKAYPTITLTIQSDQWQDISE